MQSLKPNRQVPNFDIRYHPIWKACIGSQLNLYVQENTDKLVKGMNVRVYTMNPRTYRLQFDVFDNNEPFYCKKEDAIRIINNEWLIYYANITTIEYIEHTLIDMAKIIEKTNPRKRFSLPLSIIPRKSMESSLEELSTSNKNIKECNEIKKKKNSGRSKKSPIHLSSKEQSNPIRPTSPSTTKSTFLFRISPRKVKSANSSPRNEPEINEAQ